MVTYSFCEMLYYHIMFCCNTVIIKNIVDIILPVNNYTVRSSEAVNTRFNDNYFLLILKVEYNNILYRTFLIITSTGVFWIEE